MDIVLSSQYQPYWDFAEGIVMGSELGSLVDALPGLVWAARPDGHADYFNQRWYEYTGRQGKDDSGREWQKAVHLEDLPAVIECWRLAAESGQPREVQARLLRNGNLPSWFLFRVIPLADGSGRVVNWGGVNSSFDDRGLSEEQNRAQWWLSWPARESHFRSVADSIPALASLMTPTGEFELVNNQILEYYGLTFEQLQAPEKCNLIHPDDLDDVIAIWDRAFHSGHLHTYEVRLRRADGVFRWFRTSAFPLHDTQGRIVVWYLLQTDIDEVKKAQALLASEKLLLEMIASRASLSAILDRLCDLVEELCPSCGSCSISQLDPETRKLWLAASLKVPEAFAQAIDGLDIGPESGSCGAAAYYGKQVTAFNIATDPNWSKVRDVAMANAVGACTSTPLFAQQAGILGTLAVYHSENYRLDEHEQEIISRFSHLASIAIERHQAESTLRRGEAFLAKAQALSRTGSFGWNVATDQHTWSDETYRIFEYEIGSEISFPLILKRAHPEDVHLVEQAVALAVDGRNIDYEARFRMPSGSVKHIHIVAEASQEGEGPTEFIGAAQDVTATKASEVALERARSELAHMSRITSLGTLTASIAHEVSQPLSGIITNANTCLRMLAADPPNVTGALETARRTIRDGNRASDVITRLRALFGKSAPTTEWVDLNEAILEVVAISSNELRRCRAVVRPDLAPDLPLIMGDKVQLQQVVMNLLVNALDAMQSIADRPKQLIIKTRPDDDGFVQFTLQDSGVGLEPDEAEKLFEPFYTTKSAGMGIGLAISRSIIDNHRGRLWAAPNDGPGATFSFSVPCALDSMLPNDRQFAALALTSPSQEVWIN